MKKLILPLIVFTSMTAFGQVTSTNGTYTTGSTNNLALRTGTVTTDKVVIVHSTGNVGVGTAAASVAERLHVTGNTRTSGNFLSDAGIFNVSSTSNLSLRTNNSPRLTILNSNGFVGIGTITPAYNLDVSGTINATFIRIGGNALVTSQWTTAGTNINYNNAGMVSIGTTTAPTGYKLAVGGKIVAEEIVVKLQANWPDYVFESEYKLPTLEELQLFIAEHKHLPGIPTAKEVEEHGVAIGEMNIVLLKKIEELTLYVLDLKKEVEQLKTKSNQD